MANWLWWLIIALFLHNCCYQVNHRTVIIIYSHWLSLSHTDHKWVFVMLLCLAKKTNYACKSMHHRERREEKNTQANVTNPLKDLFPSCPFYYHFIVSDGFILSAFVAWMGCPAHLWKTRALTLHPPLLLVHNNTTSSTTTLQWELHGGCIRLHSVLQGWCSHALPAIVCLAMDMHII